MLKTEKESKQDFQRKHCQKNFPKGKFSNKSFFSQIFPLDTWSTVPADLTQLFSTLEKFALKI